MMSQMEKSTKPPPSICAPSNTYTYLWLPIFLPCNSNSWQTERWMRRLAWYPDFRQILTTSYPKSWALEKVNYHTSLQSELASFPGLSTASNRKLCMESCVIPVLHFAVMNVRHLYTAWEKNPEEMIERSKLCTSFPPISQGHVSESTSESQESICNNATKAEYDSAFVESPDEVQTSSESQQHDSTSPNNVQPVSSSHSQQHKSAFNKPQDKVQDASICDSQQHDSAFNKPQDKVHGISSSDSQQHDSAFVDESSDEVQPLSSTDLQQHDSAIVESQHKVPPASTGDSQQPCRVEESSSTEATSEHNTTTDSNGVEQSKTLEMTTHPDTIPKNDLHATSLSKLPDKVGFAITKHHPLPHNSIPSQRPSSSVITRDKQHRLHSKFPKHKFTKPSVSSKPDRSLPTRLSSSELLTGSPIITNRSAKQRNALYDSHEKGEESAESEPVSCCHTAKRSPEELVVIQSRVRDSLLQQGVVSLVLY